MKNYVCAHCHTVIQSDSDPSRSGCPNPRKNFPNHSWKMVGKVGKDTYQCRKTGVIVKTDSQPDRHDGSNGSYDWTRIAIGERIVNTENRTENRTSSNKNLGNTVGSAAEGLGNGVGNLVSGTLSGVGNLAGKGWDALNKEGDKIVENNKRKRQVIEDKAKEISNIEFGSTKDEIQNQLEQLIVYGKTLVSEQTPIKKAVFSKVSFGIMRLKNLGANDTAEFFETESKKIKPNLWNTIWYWATFSNTY